MELQSIRPVIPFVQIHYAFGAKTKDEGAQYITKGQSANIYNKVKDVLDNIPRRRSETEMVFIRTKKSIFSEADLRIRPAFIARKAREMKARHLYSASFQLNDEYIAELDELDDRGATLDALDGKDGIEDHILEEDGEEVGAPLNSDSAEEDVDDAGDSEMPALQNYSSSDDDDDEVEDEMISGEASTDIEENNDAGEGFVAEEVDSDDEVEEEEESDEYDDMEDTDDDEVDTGPYSFRTAPFTLLQHDEDDEDARLDDHLQKTLVDEDVAFPHILDPAQRVLANEYEMEGYLTTLVFPQHFTDGEGSFENSEMTSLHDYLIHCLYWHDGRFAHDPVFVAWCTKILMRRKVSGVAVAMEKNRDRVQYTVGDVQDAAQLAREVQQPGKSKEMVDKAVEELRTAVRLLTPYGKGLRGTPIEIALLKRTLLAAISTGIMKRLYQPAISTLKANTPGPFLRRMLSNCK
jgi:hypothetical protein